MLPIQHLKEKNKLNEATGTERVAQSPLGSDDSEHFIVSKNFFDDFRFEVVVELRRCAVREIDHQILVSQVGGKKSAVQRKTD